MKTGNSNSSMVIWILIMLTMAYAGVPAYGHELLKKKGYVPS